MIHSTITSGCGCIMVTKFVVVFSVVRVGIGIRGFHTILGGLQYSIIRVQHILTISIILTRGSVGRSRARQLPLTLALVYFSTRRYDRASTGNGSLARNAGTSLSLVSFHRLGHIGWLVELPLLKQSLNSPFGHLDTVHYQRSLQLGHRSGCC